MGSKSKIEINRKIQLGCNRGMWDGYCANLIPFVLPLLLICYWWLLYPGSERVNTLQTYLSSVVIAILQSYSSLMDLSHLNALGKKYLLIHSFPMHPFPTPLKISQNLMVFYCFHGVEKRCIGNECVTNLVKNYEINQSNGYPKKKCPGDWEIYSSNTFPPPLGDT